MPVALDQLVMRCAYCGVEQPVPDLVDRQRLLLEQQREQRIAKQAEDDRLEQAAREARQEAKADRERDSDRRDARRSRRGTWIFSTLMMLIAPTIIAITVFDLPARLGYGASGSDRLELMKTQLIGNGCTVVSPIDSEYATGTVTKLVHVEAQCVCVIAAGGSGHSSLSLKLFGGNGKELAHAGDTTDPQLAYCAPAPDTLRYEIATGPASKGRLSHMVLACPAPANEPATKQPRR